MRLIDADISFKEVYFNADERAIYPIAGRANYKTLYGISLSDCERIVRFYLDNAPTVDPVKHGRWIPNRYGEYDCSVCKSCIALSEDWHGHPRYCSVCGAKMEVSDEKA